MSAQDASSATKPSPTMTFDAIHGPIIGECRDTSIVIWYRDETYQDSASTITNGGRNTTTDGDAPRVEFWPTSDPSQKREQRIELLKDADWTSKTLLLGLTPNTHYTYQIKDRGGTFTTPPSNNDPHPRTVNFVFGSCIGGQGYGRNKPDHPHGPGFAIFQAMLDCQPDFAQINGDSIYADVMIEATSTQIWNKGMQYITQNNVDVMPICNTLDEFRGRYKYHLEDPILAKFLRQVPIFNTWDDHGKLSTRRSSLFIGLQESADSDVEPNKPCFVSIPPV